MNNSGFKRDNNRKNDQKRETKITVNYLKTNPHSVMMSMGNTKVLCAATAGNRIPSHILNTGKGWVSAQYSMLPSSSYERIRRERYKVRGRTKEIERLIGRSLRSVCELSALPNESIIVDCDVIQADGGTRCASITGGFISLYLLFKQMQRKNEITKNPITNFLAAVSAGVVHGRPLLDLNSNEDMSAQVDLNLVMTESGRFSEIQATGEEATFTEDQFKELMELGKKGIKELITEQKKALGMF
ncbi:MAG: ribonuclease PH [Elusimicrobiota bacterium]